MCAMSPRLLRPLASGFSPRQISGLDLWFDAADSATISEAGGAGTGVSGWSNKSGLSSRDMAQATANNRPAYTAGYINGKPSLVFDGINDRLTCSSATLTNPYHVFFVMKHTGAYVSTRRFSSDASEGQLISGGRSSDTALFMLNGTPFGSAGGAPAVHPETFSCIEFEMNGASSVGRCNGAAFTTIAGGVGTGNPGGLTIGAGVGTVSGIAVSEIIVYSRTLTVSERGSVVSAMRNKWGV